MSDTEPLTPTETALRAKRRARMLVLASLLVLVFVFGYWTYAVEVPTDHDPIDEHFKYGSIGSEPVNGIPYWVWKVLPEMFPEHLPEPARFRGRPAAEQDYRAGYAQFGFLFEPGRDLPIGFSRRRLTVDRVGLNCAVCHVGTVQMSPGMDPVAIYGREPDYTDDGHVLVLGMPAIQMDLQKYFQFLFDCALDDRFTADDVVAHIDARVRLDPIERFLYGQAVPRIRAELLGRRAKLAPLLETIPPFGPGRVDTFNPYKALQFNFPIDYTIGIADLPSLWNQRPREGMQLHWDGNNTSVFERNISASLGAGVTPVSLDMPRMLRVAAWIGAPDPRRVVSEAQREGEIREAREHPLPMPGELPVPRYPFPIDRDLADRGAPIYRAKCASCHDWQGEYVGTVVPIDRIGTDRHRLDSFTVELAANQNTLGAGHWWRFHNFRKTNGYANMPLDGLWARAPYLHNGSVPTLADLLNAPEERPKHFFRGNDEYDPAKVGFRGDRERGDAGQALFPFDTGVKGNGNGGHTGSEYGTDLKPSDKQALLEYLKTL